MAQRPQQGRPVYHPGSIAGKKEPNDSSMNSHDKRWMKQYKKLMAFKQQHGHTLVPVASRYHDPSLANWVRTQRALNNKAMLRQDRADLLNEIGFSWDPARAGTALTMDETRWAKEYTKLKAAYMRNRNTLVPLDYELDASLARWVCHQRYLYLSGELGYARRCMLEEIGFAWTAPNRVPSPLERISGERRPRHGAVQQCERVFGPLPMLKERDLQARSGMEPEEQVPNDGTQKLANGGARKLANGADSSLLVSQGRVEQVPTAHDAVSAAWLKLYDELRRYKMEHGHMEVSSSENNRLCQWIHDQRLGRQNCTLSWDCLTLLNKIGFLWRPIQNIPEEREEDCIVIGNPVIPRESKTINNHLNSKRVCVWNDTNDSRKVSRGRAPKVPTGCATNNVRWLEAYDELKRYKEQHGHLRVSSSENTRLYKWIHDQRLRRWYGALSQDCQAVLDKMEFPWEPLQQYAANDPPASASASPPLDCDDIELDLWDDGEEEEDGHQNTSNAKRDGSTNSGDDTTTVPSGNVTANNGIRKRTVSSKNDELPHRSAATKKYLSNLGFDCLVPAHVFEGDYRPSK